MFPMRREVQFILTVMKAVEFVILKSREIIGKFLSERCEYMPIKSINPDLR